MRFLFYCFYLVLFRSFFCAVLVTCGGRPCGWHPTGRYRIRRRDMGNWPKGEIGSNEACVLEKKTKADVDNYNGTSPWQTCNRDPGRHSVALFSLAGAVVVCSPVSFLFSQKLNTDSLLTRSFKIFCYQGQSSCWNRPPGIPRALLTSISWIAVEKTSSTRAWFLMFIGHESGKGLTLSPTY